MWNPKVIFAFFMLAGGVVLCVLPDTGYADQGPWLISLAVGVVIGTAKKPTNGAKKAGLLLFLLVPFALMSCTTPQLSQDFIDLTKQVYATHDAYVIEDPDLPALDKKVLLGNTSACREYINAVISAQTGQPVVYPEPEVP